MPDEYSHLDEPIRLSDEDAASLVASCRVVDPSTRLEIHEPDGGIYGLEFRTLTKLRVTHMAEALEELVRLRAAIRAHAARRGHDLCWENDLELWAATLPDFDGTYPHHTVPPRDEFLAACADYWASRFDPGVDGRRAERAAEARSLEIAEAVARERDRCALLCEEIGLQQRRTFDAVLLGQVARRIRELGELEKDDA